MRSLIKDPDMHIYPGVSYRHCLVLKHTQTGNTLTPPHDIVERPIREYLPKGRHGELLTEIMQKSFYLLKDHPINQARIARGLHPASCCWIWGEGTKPALSSFEAKYNLKGGVISAVDLVKGIGICAGLKIVNVEGATGTVDTNYDGKTEAALKLLKEGCDFVYIHLEGPDECGHHGDLKNKIRAIELIDEKVLGPILAEMDRRGEPYAHPPCAGPSYTDQGADAYKHAHSVCDIPGRRPASQGYRRILRTRCRTDGALCGTGLYAYG